MHKLFVFLTAAIAAASVQAKDVVPPAPKGATVIYLSETATKKVSQDRIMANLVIREEGKDATRIQSRINRSMADALKTIKREKAVEVSTGAYSVHPKWNSRSERNDGWEAQQNLSMNSEDAATVLDLVADLQGMGFHVQGLNYYLSNDKRRSFRDDLLTDAISHIQKRATKVSKQLNLENVHIAEISLTGDTNRPQPMMRTMMKGGMEMAMDAAVPAPVAESSDEEVNLTVRATVYLQK